MALLSLLDINLSFGGPTVRAVRGTRPPGAGGGNTVAAQPACVGGRQQPGIELIPRGKTAGADEVVVAKGLTHAKVGEYGVGP